MFRTRSLGRIGAVSAIILGLTGCAKFLNAVVFNACAESVAVSFGVRTVEDEGIVSIIVPPGTAVVAKGAIADPDDDRLAFVKFEGQSSGQARVLQVDILTIPMRKWRYRS